MFVILGILRVGAGEILIWSSSMTFLGAVVLFYWNVSSRIICCSITLYDMNICAHVSLCDLALGIVSTLCGDVPCFLFAAHCFYELCIVNISASLFRADNVSPPNS